MQHRRSSHEHERSLAREARARRLGPLGEDIPARVFERLERCEPAAREETDCSAQPAADPRAQEIAGAQERRRTLGLEAEQRAQLVARTVERRRPEALAILARQIHATELEIPRDILKEVDELETGTDRVA